MNNLQGIDTYAARLLMISFFLPMQWQVWVVMGLSVYFVIRAISVKPQMPKSYFLWAPVLGGIFLLFLFSYPITPDANRARLLSLFEHKISLLLMPFVFAIISPAFATLIRRELRWFIYACIVVCAAGNVHFFYQYYFTAEAGRTLSHVAYRSDFNAYTGIHPTYMGMYLNLSICIILFSEGFNGRGKRFLKYALVYLLLFFSLALLAKSPMIALVLIFIHYAYVHRKNLYQYRMLFAGGLVAVVVAWFFIPFFSQRIYEMVLLPGHGKGGNVIDNSVSARRLIWSIDTGIFKDYWLTGVGPGRLYDVLRERYFFYSLGSDFKVAYYDPHNEYMYEWLCFGVLGIAVFMAVLLIHLVKAIRLKDHLYLYLLVTLYITFFTETALSMQFGVIFYALFTSMFFYSKQLKAELPGMEKFHAKAHKEIPDA